MELQFTTNDKVALEFFPPVPANKLLPEWYKNMPRYMEGGKTISSFLMAQNNNRVPQTIKACLPVQDYVTSGYVIRAASDIVITPDTKSESVAWWWSSSEQICEAHPHEQCPVSIKKEKHNYIKFKNSWSVKTPLGYSSYVYQPEFFFNDNFKLFPGIVDTDNYTEAISFVGMVTTKETFVIKAGDPLVVIFPFKREDWSHKIQYAPEIKPSAVARFFERGYQKLFHKQKSYC
jgi:hypothetical protein